MLLLFGSAPGATIYVSPAGDDDSSGEKEHPVATPYGAREALRRARPGPAEASRIVLAEGEYRLREPLVLEPQDGNVTWSAAEGAHPVLSGARRLGGVKVEPDGAWTVQVPEGWYFEQLWIDGRRATRARTPNEQWFQAASAATEPVAGAKLAGDLSRTALNLTPEDAATLQGLTPEELHDVNAVVYHSWNTSRHRLAGVDPVKGTLQFTGPARWAFFQMEPYHRVHLENYRGALDAPGEWFLDRKGVLRYLPRPGEKLTTARIEAPVTPRWLELKGDAEGGHLVEQVRFEGLRFAHTRYELPEAGWTDAQADAGLGAGIELDGTRAVVFADCEIAHTGGYAVWFRHGCTAGQLVHCHLFDLGGGGVKIGETAIPVKEAGATSGIAVENCIIQEGGRYFTGSVGVWIGQSGGNRVMHNDIGDFFYTAISAGWVWGFKPNPAKDNHLDYNHLHHLGWGVLSDMGAVYTLGPSPGSTVSHNRVHDISCYSYGGWGLYPDEGSSGFLLEDNLVYHTQSGGFHQHYGQDNLVRNNIFADAAEMQLRHSRTEDHLAFTFERNLVWWTGGKLLGHTNPAWQGAQVKLDHNLYWRTDGQPFDFAGKTWAEWQAAGQDAGSVIADPLFAAPGEEDFHLRPGSPAEQIGFKPFDYSLAGVEGDDAWRKLAAARTYPPMVFSELKLEPVALTLNEGFETVKAGERMGSLRVHGGAEIVSLEGSKCLKFTDGPEVKPAFNPHLYCAPHHRKGVTTFSFRVRLEADYDLVFEGRDSGTPYKTGPQLRFAKGWLTANGKQLAPLVANEWLRVRVEFATGDEDGKWSVTFAGDHTKETTVSDLPPVNAGWKQLEWLGLSSPGTVKASCWLDDLLLQHR